MAIKNETLTNILKPFDIIPDDFIKAVKEEEEKDFDLPDLKIFKADEIEDFKENIKKEFWAEAKTAGIETKFKEVRDKLGISQEELGGEGKDWDKLTEVFKNKILNEANKKPTEKIQELEKDNEKLRKNYEGLETQLTEKEKEFKFKEENRQINDFYTKKLYGVEIPEAFDVDLAIYKLKKEVPVKRDEENGFVVVNEKGEVVKNDKLNPVNPEEQIKSKFDELGWKQKEAGRGGGDYDPPGGSEQKMTSPKWEDHLKSKNIQYGSKEMTDEYKRLKKANPDFDIE